MRKRRLHINSILSALMLLVFSIALTPWSSLHHHAEADHVVQKEQHCTHQLHVSSHVDSCLICEAHFIKDFIHVTATFQVFLSVSTTIKETPCLSSSYATLRRTSLRGPPLA